LKKKSKDETISQKHNAQKERNSEEQRQMQRATGVPNNSSSRLTKHRVFPRRKKKSASVYTHTARQHSREGDKAPDTKTTAGFCTRRSRDRERNKEWLPDDAKEGRAFGWIGESTSTALLVSSFPLTEGTRKLGAG
jgi:hypothetical protein